MVSAPNEGFTAEERKATQERARELRTERQAKKRKADDERDVLVKMVEMPELDRKMAGRIHTIIKTVAPELTPKTWYGKPAYIRDSNVICFFQSTTHPKPAMRPLASLIPRTLRGQHLAGSICVKRANLSD